MMHTMNNEDSEYCLRWHKHFNNFMENFEALLVNETLADVSFLVDDGSCIKAHKVVLSFCSNYFQNLFKETMDKYPIIILKDVQSVHLRMLLEFMYTGQVNIPQEALKPLMNIARSLRIKGLIDGVVDIEKLSENENETPMSLIHPKAANNSHYNLAPHSHEHSDPKPSRSIPAIYNTPSTSVLSSALTMPTALSLASPLTLASLPPNFASSLASTLTSAMPQSISSFLPPRELPQRDGCHSPMLKRRRRHRRRSGETHDSGDSDARSSGSPGDSASNISLPKIPATITPVGFHRHHMHHLNSHLQHQQQPRDLSMHAPQNQNNAHANQDRTIHFSPLRERPPSIKIPPNIPGLLHHPPIENHNKPQEEPENLEHRPQNPIKQEEIEEERVSRDEERLNNQSQSTNSSPHDEKSSPLTSGRRSEERSAPLRISPKFSSDPESLVSPAKGLHSRLEETSSDNNHFSEEDRDENNTTTSQKENSTNDRLSDSTPGPSTSRPQSEEAPHTPSLLGWPYASESNLSEEHYAGLPPEAVAANHEYVKALLRATMLPQQRPDFYARPTGSPLGLPSFMLKGRDKPGSKSIYPYPEPQKQFSCEKCGRSYASTGNLKRHKKYECGVEPQFSCPVCQKKFQHRHSVKIHVYSTHRTEAGEPIQDNKDSLPIYPTTESVPAVNVPAIGGGPSSWIAQGPPAPASQQPE